MMVYQNIFSLFLQAQLLSQVGGQEIIPMKYSSGDIHDVIAKSSRLFDS